MLRARSVVLGVMLLLLLSVVPANGCSLIAGYFFQVAALRGEVVGSYFASKSAITLPRWFRQSFARKHAKLTLYDYRLSDMPPVRTAETDTDGHFDFGPLKAGHYTLLIDDVNFGHSDSFDVEVKDLPQATASVTIDVSPIHPDCTGGHEFIVKTK